MSYCPVHSKHVMLADNTLAPVRGIGSINILFDGQVLGLWGVLHVPSLCLPLYLLKTHRRMNGCGFIGDNARFHIYFPSFIAIITDDFNSYVPYMPLGHSSSFPFAYRQTHTPPVAHVATSSTPTPDSVTHVIQSYIDDSQPLSPIPPTDTPTPLKKVSWAPILSTSLPPWIDASALLPILPQHCSNPPSVRLCNMPNSHRRPTL